MAGRPSSGGAKGGSAVVAKSHTTHLFAAETRGAENEWGARPRHPREAKLHRDDETAWQHPSGGPERPCTSVEKISARSNEKQCAHRGRCELYRCRKRRNRRRKHRGRRRARGEIRPKESCPSCGAARPARSVALRKPPRVHRHDPVGAYDCVRAMRSCRCRPPA